MVAGTPRCTTGFTTVQEGIDRAALALLDAAPMPRLSCCRDVGSVSEGHKDAVRGTKRRMWYKGTRRDKKR